MVRTGNSVLDHLAHRLRSTARPVGHDLVRDAERRVAVQVVRLEARQPPALARVVGATEVQRDLTLHPVSVRALKHHVARPDLLREQDQLRDLGRRGGGTRRGYERDCAENSERTAHTGTVEERWLPGYCPSRLPAGPSSSA